MKFFTYPVIAIVFLLVSFNINSQTKYKAKDQITTANTYAQSHYPGGVMYAITSALGLDSTGKATTWLYYYYKPNTNDSSFVVSVTVIIIPIAIGTYLPPIPGVALKPLGVNFCNSDESITAAENAGGREFRRSHPGLNIIASVFKPLISPDTSKAFWTYIYNDTASLQSRVYNIDGTTCQLIILGVNNISNEIPEKLELHQNYPNPFNPSTKIKFSVPENDYVKISVYDITGQEISIIVNEHMKPGTYEVSFEAPDLASGVYIYKIQTSGYSESKKMLLIK